jgi:hypothetical protein
MPRRLSNLAYEFFLSFPLSLIKKVVRQFKPINNNLIPNALPHLLLSTTLTITRQRAYSRSRSTPYTHEGQYAIGILGITRNLL